MFVAVSDGDREPDSVADVVAVLESDSDADGDSDDVCDRDKLEVGVLDFVSVPDGEAVGETENVFEKVCDRDKEGLSD